MLNVGLAPFFMKLLNDSTMWHLDKIVRFCQEQKPFRLHLQFNHGLNRQFKELINHPEYSSRIKTLNEKSKKTDRCYSLIIEPEELIKNKEAFFGVDRIEFIENENENFPDQYLLSFLVKKYKIPFSKFVQLAIDFSYFKNPRIDEEIEDNPEDAFYFRLFDWDEWFKQEYEKFISIFKNSFQTTFEEYREIISKQAALGGIKFDNKIYTYTLQRSVVKNAERELKRKEVSDNRRRSLFNKKSKSKTPTFNKNFLSRLFKAVGVKPGLSSEVVNEKLLYFAGLQKDKDLLERFKIYHLFMKGNVPRLFSLETLKMLPMLPPWSIRSPLVFVLPDIGYFENSDRLSFGKMSKAERMKLVMKNFNETMTLVRDYYEKNLKGCASYPDPYEQPPLQPIKAIPDWVLKEFPVIEKFLKNREYRGPAKEELVDIYLKLRNLYFSRKIYIQEYSDLYLFTAVILSKFAFEKRPIEMDDVRFFLEFSKLENPKTRFDIGSLRGSYYFNRKENKLFGGWELNPLEEKYYHSMSFIESHTLFEALYENPEYQNQKSMFEILRLIREFNVLDRLTINFRQKIISFAMARFDLKLAAEAAKTLFPTNSQEYSYITEILNVQEELIRNGSLPKGVDTTNAYREYVFHVARRWEKLCDELLRFKFQEIASIMNKNTVLVTGKIPDFILKPELIVRDAKGRIKMADIIVDAKKSILAISDDVELYAPYCNELWFLILDDNVRFDISHVKVRCVYAETILKDWGLPENLSSKVVELYHLSMDRVEGFRRYLLEWNI